MGIGMVLVVSKVHASDRPFTNERKGDWTNHAGVLARYFSTKDFAQIRMWKKLLARGRQDLGGEPRCGAFGGVCFDVTVRAKAEC